MNTLLKSKHSKDNQAKQVLKKSRLLTRLAGSGYGLLVLSLSVHLLLGGLFWVFHNPAPLALRPKTMQEFVDTTQPLDEVIEAPLEVNSDPTQLTESEVLKDLSLASSDFNPPQSDVKITSVTTVKLPLLNRGGGGGAVVAVANAAAAAFQVPQMSNGEGGIGTGQGKGLGDGNSEGLGEAYVTGAPVLTKGQLAELAHGDSPAPGWLYLGIDQRGRAVIVPIAETEIWYGWTGRLEIIDKLHRLGVKTTDKPQVDRAIFGDSNKKDEKLATKFYKKLYLFGFSRNSTARYAVVIDAYNDYYMIYPPAFRAFYVDEFQRYRKEGRKLIYIKVNQQDPDIVLRLIDEAEQSYIEWPNKGESLTPNPFALDTKEENLKAEEWLMTQDTYPINDKLSIGGRYVDWETRRKK